MNQTDKDQWIEDTLNSLEGSQRPAMPEGLFEKAIKRAAYGRARVIQISSAQVRSAAACALVLVVANLFICRDFSYSGRKADGAKERFAKEYFGSSETPHF